MITQEIVRLVWLAIAFHSITMTVTTLWQAWLDYRSAQDGEIVEDRITARILLRDEMMTIGTQITLTAIAVHAWLDPDQAAARGLAYTLVIWMLGWNSLCRRRDRVKFGRHVHLPPVQEHEEEL